MGKLSAIGRGFYGTGIAGIGFATIYYSDFPYMLIPSEHGWMPGLTILAYVFGALLILAGACIVFKIRARLIALLLGSVLLLIFCLYFIPYQLIVSKNNMHFGDWENAAKELALSGGAFVVAACFSEKNESIITRFLRKLIPSGAIVFAATIISFGIDHFLYAKGAAEYIPSWIPNHIFWIYVGGVALLGSGIAIILKIKLQLVAALLGTMIFTWFIILHIPKAIAAPVEDMGGEATSAFLALAYSGIAFIISGGAKSNTAMKMR